MLPRPPSTLARGFGRLSTRLPSTVVCRSHAILHLWRHPVIPHDSPRVAQAAAFALDDKAPQRLACFGDQFSTRLTGGLALAIVLTQSRERGFERSAGAAKRGGLFLRYLIIERVGDRCGTAAEGDHVEADIVAAARSVSAVDDQCRQSSALPGHDRNSGSGVEVAARPGLETMAREYIFRRGIRTNFIENRQPTRNSGMRRA